MKKVAVLIDEMFEDSEFIYPYYRFIEAGFTVDVVAREKGVVHGKKGTVANPTHVVDEVKEGEYEAVYIPGGYSPDKLRRDSAMAAFVKRLYEEGKTVCAVCHGPSLLVSAGILDGKRVTAFHSIKDDVRNAGAVYTGTDVEVDGNIVTARDPQALPGMMKALLAKL